MSGNQNDLEKFNEKVKSLPMAEKVFDSDDTLDKKLKALDELFNSGAMKVDKLIYRKTKRGTNLTPPKKKRK